MLRFEIADALTTDLFDAFQYDTAIATEFLEHIDADLSVIGRLRSGTHVIATVPNYPWKSHVRHFHDAHEVQLRYGALFSTFEVFPVPRNPQGRTIFVFEGTKA